MRDLSQLAMVDNRSNHWRVEHLFEICQTRLGGCRWDAKVRNQPRRAPRPTPQRRPGGRTSRRGKALLGRCRSSRATPGHGSRVAARPSQRPVEGLGCGLAALRVRPSPRRVTARACPGIATWAALAGSAPTRRPKPSGPWSAPALARTTLQPERPPAEAWVLRSPGPGYAVSPCQS
jgi:hypothetical protein